jgi:hypothetical protein
VKKSKFVFVELVKHAWSQSEDGYRQANGDKKKREIKKRKAKRRQSKE